MLSLTLLTLIAPLGARATMDDSLSGELEELMSSFSRTPSRDKEIEIFRLESVGNIRGEVRRSLKANAKKGGDAQSRAIEALLAKREAFLATLAQRVAATSIQQDMRDPEYERVRAQFATQYHASLNTELADEKETAKQHAFREAKEQFIDVRIMDPEGRFVRSAVISKALHQELKIIAALKNAVASRTAADQQPEPALPKVRPPAV
jgi:hypothetical protein